MVVRDHPFYSQRWRCLVCHLVGDDLDELHATAAAVGLKREWFQQPPGSSTPHYDLMGKKIAAAERLGVPLVDRDTMLDVVSGHLTTAGESVVQ